MYSGMWVWYDITSGTASRRAYSTAAGTGRGYDNEQYEHRVESSQEGEAGG
jgi:hypothetical protein